MLMPSIFGENLFDDFFTLERPQKQYEKEASCDLMKTDIREYEGGFELDINLPGCKKEDIQAELKDGTLTSPPYPIKIQKRRQGDISAGNGLPAHAAESFMWARRSQERISGPGLRTAS